MFAGVFRVQLQITNPNEVWHRHVSESRRRHGWLGSRRDEAMYMAKKAGGDRAHVAPEPNEQDPTTT